MSEQKDIKEIRKLLLADDDDEDPVAVENLREKSDIASEDEVTERKEDSCTEQDCTEESEAEEDYEEEEVFLLARDKITKWTGKLPVKAKCKGPENVLTCLPGVIGTAKYAKTAEECWNYFF